MRYFILQRSILITGFVTSLPGSYRHLAPTIRQRTTLVILVFLCKYTMFKTNQGNIIPLTFINISMYFNWVASQVMNIDIHYCKKIQWPFPSNLLFQPNKIHQKLSVSKTDNSYSVGVKQPHYKKKILISCLTVAHNPGQVQLKRQYKVTWSDMWGFCFVRSICARISLMKPISPRITARYTEDTTGRKVKCYPWQD